MVAWKNLGDLLLRKLRRLPADLAAIVMLTVFILGSVSVLRVNETSFQILIVLPLVLFIPGYTLVAALFPAGEKLPTDGDNQRAESNNDMNTADETIVNNKIYYTINGIERVALSFVLNIVIVSVLWLGLGFTSLETRLMPFTIVVSAITVLSAAVATQRRLELPDDEQFSLSYSKWINLTRQKLLHPNSHTDQVLNILLIISLLMIIGSVGYAVAVPPQDGFSEFYLLTESEDGTLVADGYPSEFVGDESKSVILGISNNEHEPTEYTVIAEIQRVETVESGAQASTNPSADNSIETEIIDREQLGQLTTTLDHEETVHKSHELNPRMTGEDLRIQYLLFKNTPPANPTRENAYRSLRLWVDVFETEEDRGVATA